MKTIVTGTIVAFTAILAAQAPPPVMVEWLYVGGTQAHTKYSPLTDVNRSNVDALEIVWEWDPNEMPMPE